MPAEPIELHPKWLKRWHDSFVSDGAWPGWEVGLFLRWNNLAARTNSPALCRREIKNSRQNVQAQIHLPQLTKFSGFNSFPHQQSRKTSLLLHRKNSLERRLLFDTNIEGSRRVRLTTSGFALGNIRLGQNPSESMSSTASFAAVERHCR